MNQMTPEESVAREKVAEEIDWTWFKTQPVFMTLYCRCGASFRGHAKAVQFGKGFIHAAMNPCPQCGKRSYIYRASSDPELWTIK